MEREITFRRLSEVDFDLLFAWLNTPHVARRWGGEISRPDFEQDYGQDLASKNYFAFIAACNGDDFAFVQSYRASEVGQGWWSEIKDPTVFGIDYFIGREELLGQGLGSLLISHFVNFLRKNFVVSRVISDPPPDNVASIRSLAKAGFQKRGIVKTPDGLAQLMELDCGLPGETF